MEDTIQIIIFMYNLYVHVMGSKRRLHSNLKHSSAKIDQHNEQNKLEHRVGNTCILTSYELSNM